MSVTGDATPFDLRGSLPNGITVLEASAGTGKTYTIAGLVARYVAEGHELPQLLVVTFTRSATAELRERVRRRLVDVADHLERVLAGADPASNDTVAALLADGTDAERHLRRRRLLDALTTFDAATIATIHGFCQHVLRGIGLAADVDREAELVDDQSELVEQVVDDLYVRTFHDHGGDRLPLKRRELHEIATVVVGKPDARLVPTDPDDPTAALRVRLAGEIRREVARRKRAGSLLSYDDLLTRLRETLVDPVRGEAAAARLRGQYRVALIDEFQDTDPIQWDILSRAFGRDGSTLLLIGDPKQAIYRFRGADVYTYLAAGEAAATRRTLVTNWRSDGPLLDAYNALFRGAEFGDDRIRYRQVSPAPHHAEPRLETADGAAATPLRIRVVTRDADVRLTRTGLVRAPAARSHIADDLADEVLDLLESGTRIVERRPDGSVAQRRQAEPRDIAVLAWRNHEAALIQRTLMDAGIPAVINGVGSVFATPAATAWLRLLEALERPSSPSRARAAALTPFLGHTAEELAVASDEDLQDDLHVRLHRWAAVLRDHSVASLLGTISLDQRLPERLLPQRDGERTLTDIEHVGELLHAAATAEELGTTALTGWLTERISEAEDVAPEEQARRLESDAEAVQVLTIHRSKGLEFPIVLCPYLWAPGQVDKRVPVFHPDGGGQRVVDVGGERGDDEYEDHGERTEREQRGEELRMLYVALTRARHQAVVWWAPCWKAGESALAKMLFCRGRDGPVTRATASVPKDEQAMERLAVLAAEAEGLIEVSPTRERRSSRRHEGREATGAVLDAARFDRDVDHRWQRTSYSALTAVTESARVGSEPDEAVKDDEAGAGGPVTPPAELDPAEDALREVVPPLGAAPGGTEFGTLVHAVFEEADLTVADLRSEMERHVRERFGGGAGPEVGDLDALVDGLVEAARTPLGPLADDLRLCDLGEDDQLAELDFELPLVGGTDPSGLVSLAAIGDVLRRHDRRRAGGRLDDDPLHGYADRLADRRFHRHVRGYLTGSIDLTLRLRRDGDDRFLVADYKTNRLAPWDEPLTLWHYRPAALAEAMAHGTYPLQALLYQVALHRFLRWRIPGYDPGRHLGGVLYLFVRGMVGADTPRIDGHPCGVFAWRPAPELVVDLSDLLDRGEVAA